MRNQEGEVTGNFIKSTNLILIIEAEAVVQEEVIEEGAKEAEATIQEVDTTIQGADIIQEVAITLEEGTILIMENRSTKSQRVIMLKIIH